MSAQEIIEQIKALPPEELEEVHNYLRSVSAKTRQENEQRRVRYASDEQAEAAGDAVMEQFSETFRRLAQ